MYPLPHFAGQPCRSSSPWPAANSGTQRLAKQLEDLDVPFVDDFPTALQSADHVVDAIFGSCPPVLSSSLSRVLVSRLNRSFRLQFLGRGPGTVSRSHPGHGRDQSPGDLGRCAIVLGYRRGSSQIGRWQQLPSWCLGQPHSTKTSGQALQGSSFHRGSVRTASRFFPLLSSVVSG